MIGSEFVDQLPSGSYNLSTSPYTVSNMQGDLYDYHFIIFVDTLGTTTGNLDVILNSDTGTNYNRYYMRGLTTTASANVTTSAVSMRLTNVGRQTSGLNTLAMGSLTGSSGDERKMSCMYGASNNSQVYVYDYYWTNTVDEVTSMTFTGSVSASYTWHIMVYRTPKDSVQGTWEFMKELNWSAETAEKSFSSLDGDTDIQYMIAWEGDQELNVELNNDAGSNYVRQYLQNAGGTLSAANSTTNTSVVTDGLNSSLIINAESGVDRLIYSSASNTSSAQQSQRAVWWQNTADNLTSLDLTPSASATGTAKLYRRINPKITADVFPFETIKTFAVSGDYSAGDTLSGLSLDSYKMVKIEWLGSCASSGGIELRTQLNSDTGSNYTYQFLNGFTSSASAATGTVSYLNLSAGGDASEMRSGVIYLYPKSGEYRPVLHIQMQDEDQIVFYANWWLNSADEITSIKTYASNTNSLTGEIRISVLR